VNEPGVCVAQDKQVDLLDNFSAGGAGFDNREGCQMPEVSCDKSGNVVTAHSCRCLDPGRTNNCSSIDNCGCSFPTAITIGAFGASQRPMGVAAAQLRPNVGYDMVVPSEGGLDFIEFVRGDYRWKGQRSISAPIHTATIADLNGDGALDIVWAAKSTCLNEVNTNLACPLAAPPPTGLVQGCAGIFLRAPNATEVDAELPDGGCRRLFLPIRPDGVCLGDFNGDQKPDLAIASTASSSIAIYLGDGHGGLSFTPDMLFLPPGITGGPLACRDLDGDGRTDIIVAGSPGHVVRFLSGH
jgi:hypothetical protein